MKRTVFLLGAILALSACDEATMANLGGTATDATASVEPPANVSKKATAALPEGVSAADLYKSPNGCYSYTVRSEGGYLTPLISPLSGRQVCD